ncbi:MAG: transposase [Candidatus Dormibacteraeota bacterium]|uniref:Mutator family transposase n=1 Tax=Candidatus Dormiibacter inghamiae TaxID=3127013 RepID=A0A934KGI0_9BACT|nr:transposase [Candidatus Dormibacteraeota bacterium]MBJ7607763.1 transposase [Candidatus Dormibacteraeota bacterium]
MAELLVGARWQRCRVHFMRNALATVPKLAQQMVAATLRTIFAQPDAAAAHEAVERVSRLFEKRYPAVSSGPQFARASQPRGLPALRRGRHLPQPAVPVAPGRCRARRAER